jgi:hypothetical protein
VDRLLMLLTGKPPRGTLPFAGRRMSLWARHRSTAAATRLFRWRPAARRCASGKRPVLPYVMGPMTTRPIPKPLDVYQAHAMTRLVIAAAVCDAVILAIGIQLGYTNLQMYAVLFAEMLLLGGGIAGLLLRSPILICTAAGTSFMLIGAHWLS